MPATSKREQLLDATLVRLQAITIAGGFNTNAGAEVHLGEAPAFGPDDARSHIRLVVEDDEVGTHQAKLLIVLPLSIQAIVPVTTAMDLGRAYRDAERVLADIKRAMELSDRTVGGLVKDFGLVRGATQTLTREPGSEFVGVSIQYRAPMHEAWGAP